MYHNYPNLLFIEPHRPPTTAAVLDQMTAMMTAAFRRGQKSPYAYRGVHTCSCGAHSDNVDWFVGNPPMKTNSLCIHYLAYHRIDVPIVEIVKVQRLAKYGISVPMAKELQAPDGALVRPEP